MCGIPQKGAAARFPARLDEVLNKVIHRPVESFEISKIIHSLASIVMFHFNYAPHSPTLRWNDCASAACGGCVN